MKKWFYSIMLFLLIGFIKCLLHLRYRIRVDGLENLKLSKTGMLLLPNHSAEIDPVILMVILWEKTHLRPLVVEHFFYLKGLRFFMNLVRAMPIPSQLASANKWKMKQVEKLFTQVNEELKKGKSFLIYPAGRLKLTGKEQLGGASFVYNLVQNNPETALVLIRITGLWGSRFSRAITGKVPEFGTTLWECFKVLLKNGIFFIPKRDVLVQIDQMPQDFPKNASRFVFNKYLEDWYNCYPEKGSEPLKRVSYAFWKKDFIPITSVENKSEETRDVQISANLKREIFEQLSLLSHRPVEDIQEQLHLAFDLGLDSLDIAGLYIFLDERFGIGDLPEGELNTVEDLLHKIAGAKNKEINEKPRYPADFEGKWFREHLRKSILPPDGRTVPESFLLICDRMGDSIACADRLSGIVTYKKLKLAALVLCLKIRQMPESHIGILLPASCGAYVIILACLLAKKIPVMLNWTVGTKALDYAAELIEIKSVITSYRFLSKLDHVELGKVEEKLLFIEDLRHSISWKQKAAAFMMHCKSAKSLLKQLNLSSLDENEPMVILFTSGTEALPKAVPLTHKNVLSNQRAGMSCINWESSDVLYGVLPPFHSFGFSVTGIFPLLAGIKIFYAPDPTNTHGMVNDIATIKPSLFFIAPSFLKALFKVADPEKLLSIRLFIAGAEKVPPELFNSVQQLGAGHEILEGYGITECGPIVTLMRPGVPKIGVGQPLPSVELCVIASETHEVLKEGEEGEICIRGPNVFLGYLGNPRSPFININGKQWYLSGDRGKIDPNQNLILTGRLKRFIKIGAEMIGLTGLEEELLKLAKEKNWISSIAKSPALALTVKQKNSDKPLIILFTTFPLTKEEVNASLRDSGYGRIIKIAEVWQLDEIPLTATGKTHYRLLDDLKS